MIPLATVFATAVVTNAPARFAAAEIARPCGATARVCRPTSRLVRGVVKAVREVEGETDDDHNDEERVVHSLEAR